MAINRQDYQYVYNTLPSEKIPQDDGTLKVGAVVENLLPRLSDDTVYNPELDYYAGRDSSRCWSVLETTNSTTKEENVTDRIDYSIGGSIVYSEHLTADLTEGWSYELHDGAVYESCTIDSPASIRYDGCSGRICYFTATLSSSDWEYHNPEDEQEYWYAPVCYGYITYTIKTTTVTTTDDTKTKGKLNAIAQLDNTKQYVIQVVNAYLPPSVTTKNKIVLLDSSNKETSTSYEFDNYLCFTPKESGTYVFKINGLSFGCKVYGLNGNNIIELRNYQAPSTAQVYLFESDKPWEVDINGTITNMKDAASGSVNPTSASGLTLTAEEIENMFFEAPIIAATKNQLTVSIPNWSTVGGLYTTAAKPDTHKDLYLLTYRDCLTAENRRYNGTKLKVRRGLLRCIHKTMDINNIKLQEKIVFNGLTHPIITNGTYTISISDNMNDAANPKLWPHLGRNYSYGNQNWKEDMDTYTSVCFALGVKDENGNYKRISDFSRPVIVEKYTNNEVLLNHVFQENTLDEDGKRTFDYYPQDSIYFIKK